jgi:hypothetical protein
MTNMSLARLLLTEPRRFFAELAESPRYALPMWLIVLSTCGLTFWFYSVVNTEWLIEQSIANNPRSASMTEAQRDAAARFMTPAMLTWGGMVSTLVIIFLLRVLETLYYRIVGRFTAVRRSFRQWFAFAWWTATPTLIGVIPSVLLLMLTPAAQVDVGALAPLSLNELFFHKRIGEPNYQALESISLVMLLSLALAAFGVKLWSGRSWLFSLLFIFTVPVLLTGALVAQEMMR